MTTFLRATIAGVLSLLAFALPTAQAASLPPADGEVIVRFKADAPALRQHVVPAGARGAAVQQALTGRAQALGTRAGMSLAAGAAVADRMQVVRARGLSAAELARRLASDPQVEFAVPNGRMKRLAAPNDPLYPASATELRTNGLNLQDGPQSGQWYLRQPDATIKSAIDVETAWTRLGSRGSASVVVAVLDTGVRFEHPDLRKLADGGRLLDGYDFVSDTAISNDRDGRDGDPSDPGDWVTLAESRTTTFSDCAPSSSSWHGTSTASLVGAAADNGLGMSGAAPGVRVLPVRVLGKCYGNDSDIIAAMRWAAGIAVPGVPSNPTPAKVINLSLGGSGACSPAYQAAVDEIVAAGTMIVAAAGNSAGGPVGTPANCRGVVAVAGLRHAGTKVGFSDLGPEIAIAAPAGNCVNITAGSPCLYPILAATNTGTQGPVASTWSDSYETATVGTSFSSPLVAAVAGLMWSQQPALSVTQARSILQATARPFPTDGADNGPDDPTPVLQCVPPIDGVEQLQCYCTTAVCGAGMLDAGAAVTAAAALVAGITVTPAAPVAGSPVTFDSAASLVPAGATVTRYAWELLDGGGIASGFSSATDAATATLTPTGAGTLSVRLTITDSLGATASAEQSVTVAAAPIAPTNPPPESDGGGGGGGGALSATWLALLALAVLALRRGRRSA
jgi:serine protease